MWPDRVSNSGPLTYESGALSTELIGPAICVSLPRSSLNKMLFVCELCYRLKRLRLKRDRSRIAVLAVQNIPYLAIRAPIRDNGQRKFC